MLQAAQEALARGDAATAADEARALIAQTPDHAEAHYVLGLALRALGDHAAADAALARAAELAPDRAAPHLARAALALHSQPDTARAALDAAVQADPNALQAYVLGAQLALAARDLDRAEQQVRLAERVAPEHAHVQLLRGNLLLARGDAQGALVPLTAAAEALPDEPAALAALGFAFHGAGNLAFAEQALRRALELDPAPERVRWTLIDILRRQQHSPVEVLEVLRPLLERSPVEGRALMLAGQLHLELQQVDAALSAFAHLVDTADTPAVPLQAIQSHLLGLGLLSEAIALGERALRRQPQNPALWRLRLGLEQGISLGAQQIVERWLQACPGDAAALEVRAQLLEGRGELAAAVADARLALASDPTRLGARWVLLRDTLLNDPAAVLPQVEQLLSTLTDPAERRRLIAWRGLARHRLHDAAGAARDWLEAVQLPPAGAPLPAPRTQPVPLPPAAPELGPVLFWSAPGANARRLTAALVRQTTYRLLDDRFGVQPRPDGLGPFRSDGRMVALEQYRELLASGGVDATRAIDHLPHFDPAIRAALGGPRLLALVADPRDLLLNWLALGNQPSFDLRDPVAGARWLAHTLDRLLDAAEADPAQVLVVRSEALDQDTPATLATVQAFLQLDEALDTDASRAALIRLGGMTRNLPAGLWRAYAQVLADAFAPLQAVAARLGYPAA